MIPTVYAPASFSGNNSAVTAYVCPWKALDKTNLRVTVTDADGAQVATNLEDGSGITVTLVGNTVEFVTDTAYDNTHTVVAFLTSDYLQSNDLQNSGNNDVNVREAMFDKLTLALQIALNGMSETTGIPLSFPSGEDNSSQTIPLAPNRLDSFLYFDSNGDLTVYAYATLLANLRAFLLGDQDVADVLQNYIVDVSGDLTLSPDNTYRLFRVDATTGDVTITCPADADATIAVGSKWDFTLNSASNDVLIVGGAGATVNSAEGTDPKMTTQYAGVTIVKMAANTYQVFGRIAAS